MWNSMDNTSLYGGQSSLYGGQTSLCEEQTSLCGVQSNLCGGQLSLYGGQTSLCEVQTSLCEGQSSLYGGQSSLYGAQERKNEFRNKSIRDWDGDDCLDWAYQAEQQLSIPLSSWVSISKFQSLTGRELLRYNVSDFRKTVDDIFGPKFFKLFRNLVKMRREDKDTSNPGPVAINSFEELDSFGGSNNWTIPQIELFPEETSSLTDYGNQILVSPPCTSPMNSMDRRSPNYFTKPAILSGGSVAYGECSNSSNDPYRQAWGGSISPHPDWNGSVSPLPDFTTLMPELGELTANISNSFDINDLDTHLREESFDYLDQFLHTEDSHLEFGCNDFMENNNFDEAFSSSGSPPLQDMLKKITTGKRGNRVRHPQSWEFLVRLLINPATNPSLIRWEDKEAGVFRLVQKEEIARLWGSRSQKHKNEHLTYDNFARILRYHYKSKVLLPVSDKHLVYKLGDKVIENLKAQGVL